MRAIFAALSASSIVTVASLLLLIQSKKDANSNLYDRAYRSKKKLSGLDDDFPPDDQSLVCLLYTSPSPRD